MTMTSPPINRMRGKRHMVVGHMLIGLLMGLAAVSVSPGIGSAEWALVGVAVFIFVSNAGLLASALALRLSRIPRRLH